MNEGLIAQVGTPEDLYDRPCSRFVASFIGESNFLPGVVRGVEADMAVADCGSAIIRATAARRVSSGDAVTLAIRPERMRFVGAEADTARQNRIVATVAETVFVGERCRYLCHCEGGISMVLKEPSGATICRRSVGERVEIAWSVADTVIV